MDKKGKVIDAYLGTQPHTCVHLAMLVVREFTGVNIPLPSSFDPEIQKKEVKECAKEFRKYAKEIKEFEDGALVYFECFEEQKPHVGILFFVKGKWMIFHCNEKGSENHFPARLDSFYLISKSFKSYRLFNFSEKNTGVDVKFEDAGFIFEAILFVGAYIGEAFAAAAAFFGTTSTAFAANIALAATAYLVVQSQIPDIPENEFARERNQTNSLLGSRNTTSPLGTMALVMGKFRVVPSLSCQEYQRNVRQIIPESIKFTNDNYQLLHCGVNEIEYEPGSLLYGETKFDTLPNTSVISLSGAPYTEHNNPGLRSRISIQPNEVYNSEVETPSNIPTPTVSQFAEQYRNNIRVFSIGYTDNLTAANLISYKPGNNSSSSVRIDIPGGYYIVTNMSLYRNVRNRALTFGGYQGGTESLEATNPGVRYRRYHYQMDEGLKARLMTGGGVPGKRVIQKEKVRALGVDSSGNRTVYEETNDIEMDVLYWENGYTTTYNPPDPKYFSFHIGRQNDESLGEPAILEFLRSGSLSSTHSFDDNVVQQEGQDFVDNTTFAVRTFRNTLGFSNVEVDLIGRAFRTDTTSGRTQWSSLEYQIDFAVGGDEPPEENQVGADAFNSIERTGWMDFRVYLNGQTTTIAQPGLRPGDPGWDLPSSSTGNPSSSRIQFVGENRYLLVSTIQNPVQGTLYGVNLYDRHRGKRLDTYETIHIRVRNVTELPPPSGTPGLTRAPALQRIRVVRNVSNMTDYSYQNRLGVVIRASEFASGTPPKISVIAKGKCPVLEPIPSSNPGSLGFRGSSEPDDNVDDGSAVPRSDPGNTPLLPEPGIGPRTGAPEPTQRWSEDNRFTSNPAAWFRHILLGKRASGKLLYGLGIPLDEIDDDSIMVWYNYCEEQGLEVNAVFESNRTNQDVVNILLSLGHAHITEAKGKIGVWIDKAVPELHATAMFTQDDIVADSFRFSADTTEIVDSISYQFNDSEKNYSLSTETITKPATLGRRYVSVVPTSIRLFGVTNAEKAKKAALRQAHLEIARRQQLKISVNSNNFQLTVGDIIRVRHNAIPFDFDSQGRTIIPENLPNTDADKFLVQSIKYRNSIMELGLVRPSLPGALEGNLNYVQRFPGPVFPNGLIPGG